MTAYERRSFPGGAVPTTITADCLIGATSFTLADSSGWVGTNPITAMLDYDNTSAAEKVYGTVSGSVFTILQRGYDGTSEVDHKAGAKVRVVWDATDADEANNLVHQTLGAVTAKGDLLVATGAHVLARVPVSGTDGNALVEDSTQAAGVKFGSVTVPKTIREGRTFAVIGQPAASATDGDTGLFTVSIPAGQTVDLVGAIPVGITGTGLTWKLRRYTGGAWADITNFGTTAAPLSDSTSVTGQSVALADGDRLALYVVAAGSGYASFELTVLLDRTV